MIVVVLIVMPDPPPLPQAEPEPATTPDEFTCKHCVEPVIPLKVKPEAVAAPSVGVVKVGLVVIATLPVPLIEYSPSTPALLNSTLPLVPLVMFVLPTVSDALPLLQSAPVPLTTPEELTCKHCVEPVSDVVSVLESVKAAALIVPVRVGEPANTAAPVPVSSVSAPRKFADVGVARNVATPVPRPLTPVLIGKPVAFVRTPDAGVPSAGVTKVGLVVMATLPVPLIAYSPITPALSKRTRVVVPLVIGVVPTVKLEMPHVAPESAMLPLASIFKQLPVVNEPVRVPNLLVLPDAVPFVNGDGKRPVVNVPVEMFDALVVSVVAEVAKSVPLVFVQVIVPDPGTIVQSPPKINPPKTPPLLYWRDPFTPPGVPPVPPPSNE